MQEVGNNGVNHRFAYTTIISHFLFMQGGSTQQTMVRSALCSCYFLFLDVVVCVVFVEKEREKNACVGRLQPKANR